MAITFTDNSTTSTTSEANLFDVTADAHYACWIFTHNMQAGDTMEFKIYVKDQNGAAMRVWIFKTLQDAQTNEPAFFVPFVATKQYKITVKRTTGADRAFTWQRIEQT